MPQNASVLVIAGMHRSGTSLVASLCQSAGIFIGTRLLPAFHANVRGHFEDLDFLEFHQRALTTAGWRDTGFEVREDVPHIATENVSEADALISQRRLLAHPWGWKDPRTCLYLDFWADMVPEAKFLFVFRRPWDVVESLYRRNDREDSIFRDDCFLAVRLWHFYNTLILKFATTHPSRVAVREIDQFVHYPLATIADVSDALGCPLGKPEMLADGTLLTPCSALHYEELVRLASPESVLLYSQLQRYAGVAHESQPTDRQALSRNDDDTFDLREAFAAWMSAALQPSFRTSVSADHNQS